jgi:CheY-like chemotaxis protein
MRLTTKSHATVFNQKELRLLAGYIITGSNEIRTIIVLEDDADDHDILEAVLEDLNIANKVVWFTRADEAYEYLKSTTDQPFIIFSDVNLPGQNV